MNLREFLLDSNEPWTRYRTMIDLLDLAEDDPWVQAARAEILAHPNIQLLISEAGDWPSYPLKRHNDAQHLIYKISTLADFGIQKDDPGMYNIVESVMSHQSPEGAFQIYTNIPAVFGGTGEDQWSWIICDSPTSLYSLLALGCSSDLRVQKSIEHLLDLVDENGYGCKASPDLGKFKGPGKRSDACPIANVYALKALSLLPQHLNSKVAQAAASTLLDHWDHRGEYKLFLFGIGTDFQKIKYPYIWYDILHTAEVLSRFPFLRNDPRLRDMINQLICQADSLGRYTAGSMYRAWKGWSFANKKNPSPWLTFLVLRIQKRMGLLVNDF